ncbi:MAG: FHA domain-containing protein [Planctomycetes bacterium]|nr:FHA domain-containing protein [Planctomycetota bacterium]
MTMLALDWNATRVRGVLGAAGDYPLPVPLEPPGLDLPTAISLASSTPEVGTVALRNCRSAAHLVCHSFLPHLTSQPGPGPRWQAGRHSLDAREACELVWRKLESLGAGAHGIVLTVPSYLTPAQAGTLRRLAGRLPVLGSMPTALAAALAGHAEQFWTRSVLVIDVDDHALTLGWVKALADKAHLIDSRSFTQLSLRSWKERLLNVLAELCVHQHRRDPRDAPQAEQSLYDQLDLLTDSSQKHQAIQLGVQGQQWFKHLLVHPEQPAQFCAGLARQAAHEAEHLLVCWPASELPRCILLTHQAGPLPGLVEALRALVLPSASAETKLPANQETNFHEDDFGEELMFAESSEPIGIRVLPPEAPARAAHGLADAFRKGALPVGHLETIVPLPAIPPVDAGPPRLNFAGLDYLLRDQGCTVGSQFGCQLHFDRTDHPEVAPRHCEITCDQHEFTLHNRCREGTLVNDHPVVGAIALQPGDRIRLGPHGPIVRFLGRSRIGIHATSV